MDKHIIRVVEQINILLEFVLPFRTEGRVHYMKIIPLFFSPAEQVGQSNGMCKGCTQRASGDVVGNVTFAKEILFYFARKTEIFFSKYFSSFVKFYESLVTHCLTDVYGHKVLMDFKLYLISFSNMK